MVFCNLPTLLPALQPQRRTSRTKSPKIIAWLEHLSRAPVRLGCPPAIFARLSASDRAKFAPVAGGQVGRILVLGHRRPGLAGALPEEARGQAFRQGRRRG